MKTVRFLLVAVIAAWFTPALFCQTVQPGGGGSGGGTIPSTTSVLKGDGSGNAAAVTGTSTNCVLVNGTSAACSGVTGSTGQVVACSGTNVCGGSSDFTFVAGTSATLNVPLTASSAANVISAWTGTCNSTSLLGGDGACKVVSASFSGITSGTNTAAAMVVGAGASISPTSTGSVSASALVDPVSGDAMALVNGANQILFYGFDHASVLATVQTSGNFITIGSSALGAGQVTYINGSWESFSLDAVQSHKDVSISNPSASVLALGTGAQNSNGAVVQMGNATFTVAAPTVGASQVGIGSTTAASSNCGAVAAACLVINVAGTTHYVPYY